MSGIDYLCDHRCQLPRDSVWHHRGSAAENAAMPLELEIEPNQIRTNAISLCPPQVVSVWTVLFISPPVLVPSCRCCVPSPATCLSVPPSLYVLTSCSSLCFASYMLFPHVFLIVYHVFCFSCSFSPVPLTCFVVVCSVLFPCP